MPRRRRPSTNGAMLAASPLAPWPKYTRTGGVATLKLSPSELHDREREHEDDPDHAPHHELGGWRAGREERRRARELVLDRVDHERGLEAEDDALPERVRREEVARRVGDGGEAGRAEREADLSDHACRPRQPVGDHRDGPTCDRRQAGRQQDRQGQQYERLAGEIDDGQDRVGREVAGDEADDADREEPHRDRVHDDDDREAEPTPEEVGRAAQRSREHRLRDACLEVGGDGRRAEERRGHHQHEPEHEGDEDEDLRDDELDLELADALVPRGPDEARHAPGGQRDRHRGEDDEDPQDAAASGLADGELGDGDHRSRLALGVPAGGRSRATRSRKRCSSDILPERTSWIFAPIATRVETSSGTDAGFIGRTASRSPASVGTPKRSMAGRSEGLSPATRTWVSSSPSTSSRLPLATTRPWSMIAMRSQTCSTSLSRWEFRKTAAPRSAAARTMARTSTRPTGSSAEVGSSRTTSAGSPRSAAPRPSRCCIPLENPPTRSPARSCKPTISSASAAAALRRPLGMPISSAWSVSTSRALSHGW